MERKGASAAQIDFTSMKRHANPYRDAQRFDGAPNIDECWTFAVGDVHGCYDKMQQLVTRCLTFANSHVYRFIFLGDLIGRGPRSKDVIQYLIDVQTKWPEKYICLRGNHEHTILLASESGFNEDQEFLDKQAAILSSYGVSGVRQLPRYHLDWLSQLPLTFNDGSRLYVHAGIQPGTEIAAQQPDMLLTIREPFLSDERDYGVVIVHGHTPTANHKPDIRKNRVNVDTNASRGGPLTAAVFNNLAPWPIGYISDLEGFFPLQPPRHR
jgi:serine/threonine protein phosphatase 1